MMRRRPTAVYRVLDEEDLLSGADYIDATTPWPADEDLDPVDEEVPAAARRLGPGEGGSVRRPGPGEDGSVRRPGRGHRRSTGPRRSADTARPLPRGRTLCGCAGALVLAVILTRVASVLLAGGGGTARGGRPPGGHRPALAGPAVVPAGVGRGASSPGGRSTTTRVRTSAIPGRDIPRRPTTPVRDAGGGRRRPSRADGFGAAAGRARSSARLAVGAPRLRAPGPDRPVGGSAGRRPVGGPSVAGGAPGVTNEVGAAGRSGPVSSPGQEFGFER
jgi:hypothetical protein